jgi:hypothetical protein
MGASSVGAILNSGPRLTLDVDIPILITPKQMPPLLAQSKILFKFCL